MLCTDKQKIVGMGVLLCTTAMASQPAYITEIKYLLNYIAASDCRFERNGEFYGSVTAAEHIREKYHYIEDRVSSAEQFIKHAATRSSITGEKYLVYCRSGNPVPSALWLKQELRAYRNRNN